MRNSIYAIILNRNNSVDTADAIRSLRRGTCCPRKIILVDNASTDDSLTRLQREFAGETDVAFIANPENIGFAGGNNVGIRIALAEGAAAVFVFNNDATVAPDCLQRLAEAMEGDPSIGVTAPRIFFFNHPERVWQGGGHFHRWKTGPVTPEKNRLESELPTQERDVTFLSGCALLIRREVIEAIGSLSPDFFIYEEDVDFCLRAAKAGFSLRYIPLAKAWHKIEDVSKDRSNAFVFFNLARSRMLFVRRNFSRFYCGYAFVIHLGLFTPFRILQWARGSRSPGAVHAWFRGTWAGMTAPVGTNDLLDRPPAAMWSSPSSGAPVYR